MEGKNANLQEGLERLEFVVDTIRLMLIDGLVNAHLDAAQAIEALEQVVALLQTQHTERVLH